MDFNCLKKFEKDAKMTQSEMKTSIEKAKNWFI